ncbi:MAG: dockerin type I domain-containing protein [Phycisphaerae bacterium]
MLVTDIAVNGGLMVVALGPDGVAVWDVRVPASPVLIGVVELPVGVGDAYAFAAALRPAAGAAPAFAYIAAGAAGILPLRIASGDGGFTVERQAAVAFGPGDAIRDVAAAGDLLLALDPLSHVKVLTLSDPAAPDWIGSRTLQGFATAITTDGAARAYVCARRRLLNDSDFFVLDLTSDPTQLRLLGFCQASADPHSVALVNLDTLSTLDDRAYVADQVGGIVEVDISNSRRPLALGARTPMTATGLAAAADKLLAAHADDGLRVFGSSGAELTHLWSQDAIGRVGCVAARHGLVVGATPTGAYLFSDEGLSSGEPFGILALAPDELVKAAAVEGERLYLALRDTGLVILSLDESPAVIGEFVNFGATVALGVRGARVALADAWSGLRVIDCTSAKFPVELGRVWWPSIDGVAIPPTGDLFYVADYAYGVHVFDFTVPQNPILREGGYRDTRIDVMRMAPRRILSHGAHLLIGGELRDRDGVQVPGGRVELLSLGDGVNLERVSEFETRGVVTGIAWAGTRVYVVDDSRTLTVLDARDPAALVKLGTHSLAGSPTDVVVAGGQIYVAGAEEGLVALSWSFAGDLNCDGAVNNLDIDAFILALSDPAGYRLAAPTCSERNADANGDGRVDNFDIEAFVALLADGG